MFKKIIDNKMYGVVNEKHIDDMGENIKKHKNNKQKTNLKNY